MTERKATFELLSEEEEQLVLILREWNDMTTNYRLEIERLDGAWDIMMRERTAGTPPRPERLKSRCR